MIDSIEVGDYVLHKTDKLINGGLRMSVSDTTDDQARIEYFDNGVNKQAWVNKSDLVIVHKAEGGFRNAGERP